MKSKKINRLKESILNDNDLLTENVKVNISIRVSESLLNSYREEAKKLGIGYQTLMQMKLKEGLNKSIEARLDRVEGALFKKLG